MNASAAIYHDTRRKKKNDTYPIKLRVTHNRVQRYYPYPSIYDLSKEDYSKLFGEKPRENFKKILKVLLAEKTTADDIIESLGKRFSFTLFEKKFKEPKGNSKDVFSLLKTRAEKLRANDQISTAVITECVLNSLKKFHLQNSLDLEEIDVQFLNRYEKWMLKNENAKATIGMYIRAVRTVFNDAITENVIPKELYPFGSSKKDYKIPAGRNLKKALSINDIAAIYNYKPKSEAEDKAKDFWLLTYLASGVNAKDIALLKYKNIVGDMIKFERAKTERSNPDKPITISIAITPDIERIIKKWGNKSIYPGNYIFPILHTDVTAQEKYNLVYNIVKTTNKYMKNICRELGISANVTTYSARHSFSTIIRNSGRSIEFISEALGHSSIATTQNYLAGFEDDAKKEVGAVLTDFTKVG